jgi:hypothetical protein
MVTSFYDNKEIEDLTKEIKNREENLENIKKLENLLTLPGKKKANPVPIPIPNPIPNANPIPNTVPIANTNPNTNPNPKLYQNIPNCLKGILKFLRFKI